MAKQIKVVDLFCGIGGLTHGLIQEGLEVVAGIDNDKNCKFGYEYNNNASFIEADIRDITGEQISKLFGNRRKNIAVLVGCAPCQPFSKLNLNEITRKQLEPLGKFSQLISETLPDIVSMENVSDLGTKNKYPAFKKFLDVLTRNKYHFSFETVDVSEYGVPQRRKRLVLLASRLGPINLIPRTHLETKVTVREAIGHLPALKSGEISKNDRLHRARTLTPLNLKRIKATPHNGGNSRSWPEDLVLECHKKLSGKSYQGSVYGRMFWDAPAPTMTTQCTGLGNGRFGHPTQDRAISLREASIFQTFPETYVFLPDSDDVVVSNISRFIGNAVPVRLGAVIGKSISQHLNLYYGR